MIEEIPPVMRMMDESSSPEKIQPIDTIKEKIAGLTKEDQQSKKSTSFC